MYNILFQVYIVVTWYFYTLWKNPHYMSSYRVPQYTEVCVHFLICGLSFRPRGTYPGLSSVASLFIDAFPYI